MNLGGTHEWGLHAHFAFYSCPSRRSNTFFANVCNINRPHLYLIFKNKTTSGCSYGQLVEKFRVCRLTGAVLWRKAPKPRTTVPVNFYHRLRFDSFMPKISILPLLLPLFSPKNSLFAGKLVFLPHNTHSAHVPGTPFFGINGTAGRRIADRTRGERSKEKGERRHRGDLCPTLLSPYSFLLTPYSLK